MTDGVMIFIGMIFVAVALLSQGLIVPVFGESRQIFTNPQDERTEAYITGRFG